MALFVFVTASRALSAACLTVVPPMVALNRDNVDDR